MPLYGDGAQRPRLAARRRPLPRHRSWCWPAAAPGEVYNIGGGTELTNRELTELLLEATAAPDWDARRARRPTGKGHDRRYSRGHHARSARELGYAPQVPFDEGLADDRRSGTATTAAWWEPLQGRAPAADAGMTRWLVTGAGGQLGRDLVAALRAAGATRSRPGPRRRSTSPTAAAVARPPSPAPDVVVNCAAWTAVDDAETHEADGAARSTAPAPAHLAAACARAGARLVHVSTDYVFAGDATRPYAEDAPTGAAHAYGRTKLAGEQAVLGSCSRTGATWCAPPGCTARTARNFVRTMVRLAGAQRTPSTWSTTSAGSRPGPRDLAAGCVALVGRGPARAGDLPRAPAPGETTWYGLARAVFAAARRRPGAGAADHDRARSRGPAPRPAYSRARPRRPGRRPAWRRCAAWQEALREAAAETSLLRPRSSGPGLSRPRRRCTTARQVRQRIDRSSASDQLST